MPKQLLHSAAYFVFRALHTHIGQSIAVIEFCYIDIRIRAPYAFIDLFDVYSYASHLYLLFLFHASSPSSFAAPQCSARILCKYALLSCLPPLFRQWFLRLPSVPLFWVFLFVAALAQANQIALPFFIVYIKRH